MEHYLRAIMKSQQKAGEEFINFDTYVETGAVITVTDINTKLNSL